MAHLIKVPRQVAPEPRAPRVLSWLKAPGDHVGRGDSIARLGPESSGFEVCATEAGYLRVRFAKDRAPVFPGQPLALLTDQPGDAIEKLERRARRALDRFSRRGRSADRLRPMSRPGKWCLPGLFHLRVSQSPDALALTFGDRSVSYAALHRRANSVAHFLYAAGVDGEGVVGLCLPRSIEQIAVLLGILQAGGVYLPLDAGYPEERLRHMLRDTAPRFIFTTRENEVLFQRLGATTVDATHLLEERSIPNLPTTVASIEPENLAYILYTSGSTGRPKGVAIPHLGVERLVNANNFLNPQPGKIFLQFAPLTFDASTLEIWGCLLNGNRLEIYPDQGVDLERLGIFIKQRKVTTLWLTAGLFHQMVEICLEDLEDVHEILAGGDVLAPEPVERLLRELPGCTLINGYGPTENTTFTTCHRMEEPDETPGSVPIGRPLERTQTLLLDKHLQPVMPGEIAQLLTGGDGLARGYWNRPGLTAIKFIPNPMSALPGHRLYQTGDLARGLEDGNLAFIGRTDFQVKVRGFRIEPGEIERTLTRRPEVSGAMALAREDQPGDKRLIAYVTGWKGAARQPRPKDLSAYLRRRLPEHMVPSAIMTLDRFPLTANGKIDRASLPAPDRTRRHLATAFAAPRTTMERQVAAIWSEVLGIEKIGVNESFLSLGGHSLLATRVLTRIRQSLGRELPFQVFFGKPTIAANAAYLEDRSEEAHAPNFPERPQTIQGNRHPLSFSQQRLWFIDHIDPGGTAYNLAFAYGLNGALDTRVLEHALAKVCQRQKSLRTVFDAVEGTPHQIVLDRGGTQPNRNSANQNLCYPRSIAAGLRHP